MLAIYSWDFSMFDIGFYDNCVLVTRRLVEYMLHAAMLAFVTRCFSFTSRASMSFPSRKSSISRLSCKRPFTFEMAIRSELNLY